MARSPASSLARARVATAETAAVRMAVTAAAFMSARSSPVAPSKSMTAPWWASSPRSTLPGKTPMAFNPNAGAAPLRYAGMRAMTPAAPGGRTTSRKD